MLQQQLDKLTTEKAFQPEGLHYYGNTPWNPRCVVLQAALMKPSETNTKVGA